MGIFGYAVLGAAILLMAGVIKGNVYLCIAAFVIAITLHTVNKRSKNKYL